MATNVYLNAAALSPRFGFVRSELNPSPVDIYDIVYGDKLALNIYLVDGAGGFDATSGLSGYTVKVGLGLIGQEVAALQESWSLITNGWSGSIELNTTGVRDIVGSADQADAWIEIEITDPSGNRRTYGQQQVLLLNQAISGTAAVPSPSADFYTIVEANQKFVQNQSAITGLTGGTATDLDSLVTLGVAVGPLVVVTVGGYIDYYRLTAGTTAELSPTVIRPDDYATTTNEKFWQLEQHDAGFTYTQVAPATTWTVTHNLLYRPLTITIWVGDKVSMAQVDHDSTSQFTVTMDTAQSGLIRYK